MNIRNLFKTLSASTAALALAAGGLLAASIPANAAEDEKANQICSVDPSIPEATIDDVTCVPYPTATWLTDTQSAFQSEPVNGNRIFLTNGATATNENTTSPDHVLNLGSLTSGSDDTFTYPEGRTHSTIPLTYTSNIQWNRSDLPQSFNPMVIGVEAQTASKETWKNFPADSWSADVNAPRYSGEENQDQASFAHTVDDGTFIPARFITPMNQADAGNGQIALAKGQVQLVFPSSTFTYSTNDGQSEKLNAYGYEAVISVYIKDLNTGKVFRYNSFISVKSAWNYDIDNFIQSVSDCADGFCAQGQAYSLTSETVTPYFNIANDGSAQPIDTWGPNTCSINSVTYSEGQVSVKADFEAKMPYYPANGQVGPLTRQPGVVAKWTDGTNSYNYQSVLVSAAVATATGSTEITLNESNVSTADRSYVINPVETGFEAVFTTPEPLEFTFPYDGQSGDLTANFIQGGEGGTELSSCSFHVDVPVVTPPTTPPVVTPEPNPSPTVVEPTPEATPEAPAPAAEQLAKTGSTFENGWVLGAIILVSFGALIIVVNALIRHHGKRDA